jgi:hypothetical protein
MNTSKKKLYVNLQGRLGNQLFQSSAGYGWMKKYPNQYDLIFTGDKKTPPPILEKMMKDEKYEYRYMGDINPLLNEQSITGRLFVYDEDLPDKNPYVFNEYILDGVHNIAVDVFISGYFQNEKYFKEYKEDLIRYYVNEERVGELVKNYPTVRDSYFIHIRRGDYVNHGLFGIDLEMYFKSAILYILNKELDAHFYILSDDMEYCKRNPLFENINKTFIENTSEMEDFYLMSLCEKGGICSNSSFSWWGSYLNTNPEKTVIFPKKWANTNKPVDIYYEYSILIPV